MHPRKIPKYKPPECKCFPATQEVSTAKGGVAVGRKYDPRTLRENAVQHWGIDDLRTMYLDAIDALEKAYGELEQLRKEREFMLHRLHGDCPSCKHYTPRHLEGKCANCDYDNANSHRRHVTVDNWEYSGLDDGEEKG